MSKKTDHKAQASDLVKELINSDNTTPMQEQKGSIITPVETKEETVKFTVMIEKQLMKDVKKAGFEDDVKLRYIFEEALKQYLTHRAEKQP